MNAIDWNTYAKAYDLLRSIKPYRAMHDAVGAAIKQHHVHGGGFILDAGCGTGNLLTTLSEHDIPRACMVGIDAAPAMCLAAEHKHGMFGARIRTTNLDTKLPFKTGAFSVIACVNALYAVQDPAATLREFARILHPEGLLIVVTPHAQVNLGLILKAHCMSTREDAYWARFAEGGAVARQLLHEAFAQNHFDATLLEILFSTNAAITASTAMHFMSEATLRTYSSAAGLEVTACEKTYAN